MGDPQWKALVNEARERLQKDGYLIPTRPVTPLEELSIPTDIDQLGDVPLGNLSMKYMAWHAFATASMSFAHAELAACQEAFEVALGDQMWQMSQQIDGHPTKDTLRAITITAHGELKEWHQEVQRLDQRARSVQGLVQGLAIQCRALESEGIRRASVRKVEGGGK